jgi:predicted DNA-binding transcriptional regulator AlpA
VVDEGVLTAEEIARVAGVARGTVSGWRRRHADFPAPVSGTGRGPVFNQAEVEAWLAGAGRCELTPNAALWREVNYAARGTSLGRVVAAVRRLSRHTPAGRTRNTICPPAWRGRQSARSMRPVLSRYSAI